MTPPIRSEDLSPFVADLERGLRDRVDDALRAFLGLPAELPFAWYAGRPEPGDAWTELRLALTPREDVRLELHIQDAGYDGPRWLSGPDYRLSYSPPRDGGDPFEDPDLGPALRGLDERLGREAESPPAFAPVLELLRTYWEHVGVEDSMYRQVSLSGGDRTYATIRVGFRCNQDCHFCWQSRRWHDPPADLCRRWIDELAAGGVKNLVFSGGEPTLFKPLPDLITHAARRHGMSVGVETNAIHFRRPAVVRRLLEAGLERALVSFHSFDPEVSDGMTRAPGTWVRTVEGIEVALAHDLPLALNCVIERGNYRGLVDHARGIVQRFVEPFPDARMMQVIYTHPCSYYDPSHWERALVPLDELQPRLLEAARVLLAAGVNVNASGSCGFPPCLLRDEPCLVPWGTTEGFDTADLSGRTFVEACDRCAVRRMCLGVRKEYLELMGPDGIEPYAEVPAAAAAPPPSPWRA